MRTRSIGAVLACLLVVAPVAWAQGQAQPPQANPPQAPAKPAYAQDTPESAMKSFFVAMALGDEAGLKAIALPAEGFEYLLMGQHVPPDQVGALRKAVEAMTFKRLKAGDEVKLPNGQTLKIDPEQVSEDRAVLMIEGGPVPTDLYRVGGVWKVDARPVIAGRKAAAEARRRAEEAKKKQETPK
jgi:hypothetical protein